MMQEKISMKVDISAIEQEIAAHEKQLRQSYSVKARLMGEIDSLDPDDKHYIKRKADLDGRLYKMYDSSLLFLPASLLKRHTISICASLSKLKLIFSAMIGA